MNWGHGIFIAFICFGLIIFSMVGISMNQEINLVAPDYYKQEIEFQSQIDRQKNFIELADKPQFQFNKKDNQCYLNFSDGSVVSGEIHLFRASDFKLDKKIKFDKPSIAFDASDLKTGLWSARISWESQNKEYYFEESFLDKKCI